jgi:hypothetical protein
MQKVVSEFNGIYTEYFLGTYCNLCTEQIAYFPIDYKEANKRGTDINTKHEQYCVPICKDIHENTLGIKELSLKVFELEKTLKKLKEKK